jgi:hypothetical protein
MTTRRGGLDRFSDLADFRLVAMIAFLTMTRRGVERE